MRLVELLVVSKNRLMGSGSSIESDVAGGPRLNHVAGDRRLNRGWSKTAPELVED